jgi:hypothetical protein
MEQYMEYNIETINRIDNFYFDFCDKFYDKKEFNPRIPLKIYKKYFPMIPQSYFFELNNKILEILNKYGDNNEQSEFL